MWTRIVGRVTVAAVSILTAGTAHGTELQDFSGTWTMQLNGHNLFVLNLVAAGGHTRGSFDRPAKISKVNSIFFNLGGLRHDAVVQTRLADGVLHLTIQNENDAKDEDSYAMVVKENRAELTPDDLPAGVVVEPYLFDRAKSGASVATDWEPNRAYVPGNSEAPSAPMKSIYDEDQLVRRAEHSDGQVTSKSDAQRRDQTRTLLAAGALQTGKDYEEAAFLFQHGDSAEDYLLAHTLAMVSISKGNAAAIWIAAATLDRYLQKINQKQIFGTQYVTDPKGTWTQEPNDRALVSDALRQQLGVPPQAAQARQLRAYQAQK